MQTCSSVRQAQYVRALASFSPRPSIPGKMPTYPAPSIFAGAKKLLKQGYAFKASTLHRLLRQAYGSGRNRLPHSGTLALSAGLAAHFWLATDGHHQARPGLGTSQQQDKHDTAAFDATTKDAWELVGGSLAAGAESNSVDVYSLIRNCVWKRFAVRYFTAQTLSAVSCSIQYAPWGLGAIHCCPIFGVSPMCLW